MKNLITKLSMAVALLFAFISTVSAATFDTSKTYYIDASKCSWVENDGCVLVVDEGDGYKNMTKISSKLYCYTPTKSDVSEWTVARYNGSPWNEFKLKAPDKAEYNCYVTGDAIDANGSWSVFDKVVYISGNVVSDYVYSDKAYGVPMERESDGTWTKTITLTECYEKNGLSYFRFYDQRNEKNMVC